MKAYKILILFFLLFISRVALAVQYDSGWVGNRWDIYIFNNEIDSAENTCTIQYTVYFNDTVEWQHKLILDKQVYTYDSSVTNDWWVSGDSSSVNFGTYYIGDSITGSLTFSFDTNYLPYSYRQLSIKAFIDDTLYVGSSKVFVYFTPYSTIEIWGHDSFISLYRLWDDPESGLLTENRIDIPKDSIPVSNISLSEILDSNFVRQYCSIEGLPYTVIMKNMSNPDSSYNIGVNKTGDCNGNKDLYSGLISGTLISGSIDFNDDGGSDDLPIDGIKIKAMDRDFGTFDADDHIGVAYTDENGYFEINVQNCQKKSRENDELEVYFIIQAEAEDKRIVVESSERINLELTFGTLSNLLLRICTSKNKIVDWKKGE